MLLYDVYYSGNSLDRDIKLPAKPSKDAICAINTNGNGRVYIPEAGEWRRLAENEAIRDNQVVEVSA